MAKISEKYEALYIINPQLTQALRALVARRDRLASPGADLLAGVGTTVVTAAETVADGHRIKHKSEKSG